MPILRLDTGVRILLPLEAEAWRGLEALLGSVCTLEAEGPQELAAKMGYTSQIGSSESICVAEALVVLLELFFLFR